MSSTLVIILSETRASELTFDNFKKNVIDELNADLCVCIGVKPDYDYNNPYFQLAKYRFTYDEHDDYGVAFDYAYNILSKDLPKYEKIDNMNAFYGKIGTAKKSDDKITYLGDKPINLKELTYDIISVHNKEFSNKNWSNQAYASNTHDITKYTEEKDVTLYKKPLPWREFLKIKDQFMGGVKDSKDQHPGSAGILIFFRWYLLQKLIENDLINKYDRFIITRSDFIYQLPHPQVSLMNPNNIWIPNGEQYFGYTDRHVVLSKSNIVSYLNIFNNLVYKSNEFFIKMQKLYPSVRAKGAPGWNLEQLIAFNLLQNKVGDLVMLFPYVMYSVRNTNGSTRWAGGYYSNELGYFIKYHTEFNRSNHLKHLFNISGKNINDFFVESFSKP